MISMCFATFASRIVSSFSAVLHACVAWIRPHFTSLDIDRESGIGNRRHPERWRGTAIIEKAGTVIPSAARNLHRPDRALHQWDEDPSLRSGGHVPLST